MRPPVAPIARAGTNIPVDAPTPLVQIINRYVSLHGMVMELNIMHQKKEKATHQNRHNAARSTCWLLLPVLTSTITITKCSDNNNKTVAKLTTFTSFGIHCVLSTGRYWELHGI